MFPKPTAEFSVTPFWFWNDRLDEAELLRQMDDFQAHGVHGFVIHPRVGLPRDLEWMSLELLHFYRFVVEEASRRGMRVLLYDEGMYPSGSSCGQVVKANPAHHCRCLAMQPLGKDDEPSTTADHNVVAIVKRRGGERVAFVDRKADSYIRGLHFTEVDPPQLPNGGNPPEDEPPAADILNPDAVRSFIAHVYDRCAEHLGDHFGKTIVAMFTDEPNPLGKCREADAVRPYTTGLLPWISEYLGYDFTPHLPALWYDDEQDAVRYRADYQRAIAARLRDVYYTQLNQWCTTHSLPLTGHPSGADDIGAERFFHIPGQDAVWRWVEPHGPSALEGQESTQGKCGSSAALHLGRRRNLNECLGAYGHGLTYEEMKWLTDWMFVRGVNWLAPHAFYYSVRGPRVDERPPDVGPNSPWWGKYKTYADYAARMSWLNTDSTHVCDVAVLGQSEFLPWRSAKVLFQHQRDFNYLELRHLWEDAIVDATGVKLAGMHYKAVVLDELGSLPSEASPALKTLREAGRLIRFDAASPLALLTAIDELVPADVVLSPAHPDLRIRHVIKNGKHYYLFVNEGRDAIHGDVKLRDAAKGAWIDPQNNVALSVAPARFTLPPYVAKVWCGA